MCFFYVYILHSATVYTFFLIKRVFFDAINVLRKNGYRCVRTYSQLHCKNYHLNYMGNTINVPVI